MQDIEDGLCHSHKYVFPDSGVTRTFKDWELQAGLF